ncbi:MAG: deoxyhypusine synthase family protein [Planctomycetes bacterium]|nr:deoxyhypusine synthase family protein [Planctomycetota bacterium]
MGAKTSTSRLSAAQQKHKKQILDVPVKSLRLPPRTTVAGLVDGMKDMSIQARNIGLCATVLDRMMQDKGRPTIFLGLAGPLIAAGLRDVIRGLVAGGYVDVVVSTGAIIYQDIYQARGFRHFRGTPAADDAKLRELYIDRIYDTYVDEEKFWETDIWCGKVADSLTPGAYSSRQFLDRLGSRLTDDNSILRTCHKLGVPVFCPALNDSSIGIGLTHHRHECITQRRPGIMIDAIQDNYELTQIVVKSKKTAAIYVAGGVPKNYINDSIVMGYIFGLDRGHAYAIQVTTAVTADGGLSSSTLKEAQSWGKIRTDADCAMAWVEPSVALPLLAGYLFDRHPAPARPRLKFQWKGDILAAMKTPKRFSSSKNSE